MKNWIRKYLLLSVATTLLLITGIYTFTISQLTGLYPPIEEYEFTVTAPVLKRRMFVLFQNKKYTNRLSDTIGNNETGRAYYADLCINTQNKKYLYKYKCLENVRFWREENTSKIELIGAFNMTDSFGGYKIGNEGMKNLVEIFDRELVEKLKYTPNE